MTQQQPFESEGPFMTEYITNGDKRLAEMLQDTKEPPQHERMDRFEKMEFLQETTTVEFHTKTILEEMVSWMGEDDFSRFYDHLCSNWDVCRSQEELNYKYGE